MEKLKVKHDHKLTDIIKVCIFTLFLILPILCFLPTGFYYGFNEHAVAQEETVNEPVYYETNEVNSVDDIGLNKIYFWNDNFTFDSSLANKNFGHVVPLEEYIALNNSFNLTDPIVFYTGTVALVLQQNNNVIILHTNTVDMVFIDYNYNNLSLIWNHFRESNTLIVKEYVNVTYNMSISNSMYQAWQGLWQSPLYNWTNNNNFQFTINAFTNVFGITQQSYITNYLNYLLSLTAIYVVFDIVIAMFKWITHLIGEK